MNKISVSIHYPITKGVLAIHKLTLTKTIKVFQLMKILKAQLNLNHMTDIHVFVNKPNNMEFHKEDSQKKLFLFENDEIHLLSENCMVT